MVLVNGEVNTVWNGIVSIGCGYARYGLGFPCNKFTSFYLPPLPGNSGPTPTGGGHSH